jgi:hypothetical protein
MINTAREGAAAAVQAVGDKVGTVAGGVAATATVAAIGAKTGGAGLAVGAALAPAAAAGVQRLASTITDLATEAIIGGVDNPLNTNMTPSDSPKEALAKAIGKGPLTSEVACKLIDGLAPKYREDPRMMAALAVVFVRAGDASPHELQGLLDHLKIEQGSVEYREMRAKEEAR